MLFSFSFFCWSGYPSRASVDRYFQLDFAHIVNEEFERMAAQGERLTEDGNGDDVRGKEEMAVCGKWTAAEMRDYFTGLKWVVNFPIYQRGGVHLTSPMDFLIPARLEDLFEAHRASVGSCSLFPHALLVRSWPEAMRVRDCIWWKEFWSDAEVRTALAMKQSDPLVRPIDELMEHSSTRSGGNGGFTGNFRLCEMSDSFDRGVFISVSLINGFGSRFMGILICFQRWVV